jgi:hypothetical protein
MAFPGGNAARQGDASNTMGLGHVIPPEAYFPHPEA